MANAYQEIENRISQYISDHPIHKFPNISQLAREYDISYQRLYHRYHGRQSKTDRPTPNVKLDSAQELALSEFIRRRNYIGSPMRIPDVEKAANSILRECHSDPSTPPPTVGEHWTRR
jgi:Tc5 transposase DNA-binding domain